MVYKGYFLALSYLIVTDYVEIMEGSMLVNQRISQ